MCPPVWLVIVQTQFALSSEAVYARLLRILVDARRHPARRHRRPCLEWSAELGLTPTGRHPHRTRRRQDLLAYRQHDPHISSVVRAAFGPATPARLSPGDLAKLARCLLNH